MDSSSVRGSLRMWKHPEGVVIIHLNSDGTSPGAQVSITGGRPGTSS